MSETQATRICRVCHRELPETHEFFVHHPHCRGGLQTKCKDCTQAWGREHYAKDRERVLARMKADRPKIAARERIYWAANRDRQRANTKANRERHPDDNRIRCQERYRRNPEKYRAQIAAWQRANPEKMALRVIARNLLRRHAPLDAESKRYIGVLRSDPCAYCNSFEKIEIEHIVPISKGGTSEWSNLSAACRKCNAEKSGKNLLMFLMERIAS